MPDHKTIKIREMKIIISFIIGLVVVGCIPSCYYDNEELLYKNTNTPCIDSVGVVSYSQKVVPILQQNCYTCHNSSFPSGNVLMGTHITDKIIAQNGRLMGTIKHAVGFSIMPKGMPKLSNCQIATINKWVVGGMLNN